MAVTSNRLIARHTPLCRYPPSTGSSSCGQRERERAAYIGPIIKVNFVMVRRQGDKLAVIIMPYACLYNGFVVIIPATHTPPPPLFIARLLALQPSASPLTNSLQSFGFLNWIGFALNWNWNWNCVWGTVCKGVCVWGSVCVCVCGSVCVCEECACVGRGVSVVFRLALMAFLMA